MKNKKKVTIILPRKLVTLKKGILKKMKFRILLV
jgi:hypothetical protein